MKGFWDKLFENYGCPAHIFKDKMYTPKCKTGLCCTSCPEPCKECSESAYRCLVGGVIKRDLVKLFKSKQWESYLSFSSVVKNLSEKNRTKRRII